jgi:hypothetical protein
MEINPNQLGVSAFIHTNLELRVIVYTAAIQEKDSLEKADGYGGLKGSPSQRVERG